jgi:acyl dehydratase
VTVTNQTLLEATFEAMVVGDELGPVEIAIDDQYIKRAAFSVDDYHPWYFSADNPFGRRVAPAAALVADLLRLLNTKFDPNSEQGIHQKEEAWIHSPALLGERVTLSGRFVDKYVKRDKGYIVTDAEARSVEDGRLIVRHRSTEIARIEPGTELGTTSSAPGSDRRVTGEWPTDVVPLDQLHADVRPGTPVVGGRKEVDQAQMSIFSNVQAFWHTIHTDLEAARRAGLPGTLAQGLMESLYLSEFGTQLFGASWFTSGWMLTSYLQPVYAGDVLDARGVVIDRRPSPAGVEIELETWLENQDGKRPAVGWISATLPASS